MFAIVGLLAVGYLMKYP
ncbi:MAG: hypothetical protein IB616_04970 [Methanosarcinales archaeon]|nr:MAG: hypothetical protein IB616_04970 [Methanosarcinales archaeon]